MKKKLVFLLIAMISTASLFAQEGKITYKDYGPEGWSYEFNRQGPDGFDTLQIDLDEDGLADIFYRGYAWYASAPHIPDMELRSKFGEDEPYCFYYNLFIDSQGHYVFTETYGDTIPSTTPWQYMYPIIHGHGENPERPNAHYIAIRLPKENGGYCYGWLEQSIEWLRYSENSYWGYYHNGLVRVYRWAYCTIPDYPLRVGQTSFEWNNVEDETTSFASVHPNPTDGLVTITGKDLKQAEVFNPLGQLVATSTGEGERLMVDLNGLPAGIYVVNVTDTEGRKCVRKVVKE